MQRAYVAIDTGVVRLGNASLERRWSTFPGSTTEFILHSSKADQLTRKSPEYHIDYGGSPLAVTDLRDASWSERSDAYGASVTLEQYGPAIHIRLQTFLCHSRPGMIRRMEISNTGETAVSITRLAMDILPLAPQHFDVPNDDSTTDIPIADQMLHYKAIRKGRGALLLGSPLRDGFALFAPNPQYCAPVWTGTYELPPSAVWVPPPSALYWAEDLASDSITANLNGLHAEWQAHTEENNNVDEAFEQ